MTGFSVVVSQRPSHPLPTTMLASLGLKLPPDPAFNPPSPPNLASQTARSVGSSTRSSLHRSSCRCSSVSLASSQPRHVSSPNLQPYQATTQVLSNRQQICLLVLRLSHDPHILIPQVCSWSSISGSYLVGRFGMVVDSVALVWWNSSIALSPSRSLDTLGSTCVLSGGTLIALGRSCTTICRFFFIFVQLQAVFVSSECISLALVQPGTVVNNPFTCSALYWQTLKLPQPQKKAAQQCTLRKEVHLYAFMSSSDATRKESS